MDLSCYQTSTAPNLQDGSQLTFSWPFSYISFSSLTSPPWYIIEFPSVHSLFSLSFLSWHHQTPPPHLQEVEVIFLTFLWSFSYILFSSFTFPSVHYSIFVCFFTVFLATFILSSSNKSTSPPRRFTPYSLMPFSYIPFSSFTFPGWFFGWNILFIGLFQEVYFSRHIVRVLLIASHKTLSTILLWYSNFFMSL